MSFKIANSRPLKVPAKLPANFRTEWALALAVVTIAYSMPSHCGEPSEPWWNNWPRITFNSTAEGAKSTHANWVNAARGMADEGRGPYFRKLDFDENLPSVAELKKIGAKSLAWIEGQGESRSFIAVIHQEVDKSYTIDPRYQAAQIIAHNWSWDWQGPGLNPLSNKITWIGLPSFVANEDWLGPFTLQQSEFKLPAPTYVDGRPAIGNMGSSGDPRQERLYDAMSAKGIDGKLVANCSPAGTHATGKIPMEVNGKIVPIGDCSFPKDVASPWWLQYNLSAARFFIQNHLDGFWVDNYSGFDSFGSWPIRNAFGDYSVAGFRQYLAKLPLEVKNQLKLPADLTKFNIVEHLVGRFQSWYPGEKPEAGHWAWGDAKWLNDPIWRAYVSFKSDISEKYARELYIGIKNEAKLAGKAPSEIYVGGNDIPSLSLGAISGSDLDQVNTEYNPGWALDTGPVGRGMIFEGGGAGTFYSLATQFANSRHAVVWHYLEGEYEKYSKKTQIGRLLGFEALMKNTFLNGGSENPRIAGTDESQAAMNRWIEKMAPLYGARRLAGKVGLVYSTQTQLAFLAPGGFVRFDQTTDDPQQESYQDHQSGFYGWGRYLENAQIPYQTVPDFRLTPDGLKGIKILILPHVRVADDQLIKDSLEPFLKGGGILVITGMNSGIQKSKRQALTLNTSALLSRLPALHPNGQVIFLKENPGLEYFVGRKSPGPKLNLATQQMAAVFKKASQLGWRPDLITKNFQGPVRTSIHWDPTRKIAYVDILNANFDGTLDKWRSLVSGLIMLDLPTELIAKKLKVNWYNTELEKPTVIAAKASASGYLDIPVPPFESFGTLVIEALK